MEKADITKTIVELTIDKVLIDIETDTERSVRNFIDLGRNFSKGGFQKYFFEMVQKILQNDESPYYRHAKNLVTRVNHETIKTFGINLGYNGCTNGAKRIRENEEKYRFNIPWTIAFLIDDFKNGISEYDIEKTVLQGEKLGTHVYLICCNAESLQQILFLLEKFPDCAFVIFADGAFKDLSVLKKLSRYHNFMISILAEADDSIKTAEVLARNSFLYAVHTYYDEKKLKEIMSGEWIERVLTTSSTFAFLIGKDSCSPEVRNEVRKYCLCIRERQQYPIFLMDLVSDIFYIDQIISQCGCSIGFNSKGQLYTLSGQIKGNDYNIRKAGLKEILKKAPKNQL